MARDRALFSRYDGISMSTPYRLPKQPVIYEINTAIFLAELSIKYDRHITLGAVPEEEWRTIAELPVDAVWFMGVWQRSPYSRKVSMPHEELRTALPDFNEKDNLGSAYSIRAYEVDEQFGGKKGLAATRTALRDLGLGLILDYAPNHIACDHDWVEHHPEYLVAGTKEDLTKHPSEFYRTSGGIFANGKDPGYPAWSDVLQLNTFSEELRAAATKTFATIAEQCDGIRCDMAMLVTNRVFKKTWGDRVGDVPSMEYWPPIIDAVHKDFPDCVFIAEVYWNMERELLQQGFAYCYDKTLYDHLAKDTSLQLFQYVHSDPIYQGHLLRFIENHDEPRAAKTFKGPRLHTAAVILATLPGAILYHQGQLAGYRVKLPVHLGRGPVEEYNQVISRFYHQIIAIVGSSHMRDGTWQLCRGNAGFLRSTKLIAWVWTHEATRFLCVVNYGAQAAYGRFELPPDTPLEYALLFGESTISPKGVVMKKDWLSLELAPWGYAIFRFDAR
jgi:hypothetical protein